MIVAVPTETKNREYRVALTPAGVHHLVTEGHRVLVQSGACVGSAIGDDESPRLHGDALLEDVRRTLDPLAGGGR